jgi:hypothetical protein
VKPAASAFALHVKGLGFRAFLAKSGTYGFITDDTGSRVLSFSFNDDGGPMIKLCHHYAYQACEHDGWEASDARKLVDAIEAHAVRHLPGYDDAPWGVS